MADRYVYGIREKASGIMRYVGIGTGNRMYDHLKLARRGRLDHRNTFKGHRKDG